MSVDDTFDEVAYVDEVASKYLSEKELKEFRTELRPTAGTLKRSMTRTVRFGSLPCDKEGRSLSIREVDFTWNNLSFCTKNYLTKYNLVEGHTSSTPADGKNGIPGRRPSDVGNSQESVIIPCKPPRTSPVRKSSEGDNKILDIQRLKSLPKLF